MKCLHSFISSRGLSVILGSVVVVIGGMALAMADRAAGDAQGNAAPQAPRDQAQQNQRRQQVEAELARAKVAMEQAQEGLKIQKVQARSDIAGAQLELDLAVLKGTWFKETIYPLRLAELNYRIERLNRAISKSRATDNQKNSEIQPVRDLDTELELARRRLDMLVNYTKKLKETELQRDAASLTRELERVKLRSASGIRQFERHIEESETQYKNAKAKLDQLP